MFVEDNRATPEEDEGMRTTARAQGDDEPKLTVVEDEEPFDPIVELCERFAAALHWYWTFPRKDCTCDLCETTIAKDEIYAYEGASKTCLCAGCATGNFGLEPDKSRRLRLREAEGGEA
jgi:hypothetical protein